MKKMEKASARAGESSITVNRSTFEIKYFPDRQIDKLNFMKLKHIHFTY